MIMENEFCEIDFTTTTSWENFNARLEEIFYNWKLYHSPEEIKVENGECFSCEFGNWLISSEKLEFDGREFDISFYLKEKPKLKDDSKSDKEEERSKSVLEQSSKSAQVLNFFPEINCLSKKFTEVESTDKLLKLIHLFDLQSFVLLTESSESGTPIFTETNVKLLLSSFCISAFNIRCFIPIFTQVFQSWQNCYIGIRIDEDGFRVDYQMIHLGKVPSKFHYFSGILDLFKSKIANTLSPNSVWASVKLSYSLSQFKSFAWPRKRPVNLEDGLDESLQLHSFNLLFGAISEPVSEVRLHVTWPKVFENMVMDNENHSDFDPLNAPKWVLQVFATQTNHLLSQHLSKFMQIYHSSHTISELIGDLLKRWHFNELNVSSNLSLSRIIASGNISGNGTGNVNEMKGSKKFLPEETLVSMLYYLFPDADQSNAHPYKLKFSEDSKEDNSLKGMKTCGIDELPWRLSIIMCVIVYSYGPHAAAQFWYEFIQELRFRWERSLKIRGVQKGVPNHKTSLMNQKLQMLNCCIKKKNKRENIDVPSEDSDDQNNSCPNSALPVDSEDEEFFDCQTESKDDSNFKATKVSLWNQPEGRLRKFNNLRLIETGEFMYIPITQEMTPKTEDQLEDDAVVLMKLGSDSQGSKLRARMMCASLYSDMESFKAANPGSILEDFIRWYSPRDWIETSEVDQFGQKKGKLSHRMQLPGNMWKEVWDTSIPVPACRQKCLFDDNKESEKVLQFFEFYKNLSDVFSLLLPTLIHAALHIVINEESVILLRRYSSYLNEKINLLIQKAVAASRNINFDVSQYKVIADEISEIESIVSLYKSIEFKLFPGDLDHNDDERNMLMELVLGQKEIVVPQQASSRLGRRIIFLFAKENDNIGQTGTLERKKEDSGSFVNATNEFLHSATASFNTTISHNPADQWRTITALPYQKEFILYVTSGFPFSTSRPSSHRLSAHICAQEIFIASCFSRDSIFV